MSIQMNDFQTQGQSALFEVAVPLATEADFANRHLFQEIDLFRTSDSDNYAYQNAATCPDCSGGMIRQGRCCACPSCGYESCLI
jgi:hypothetical protein